MDVNNREISELFNQLADQLEIEGANRYRVRAYRKAARFISNSPRLLAEMVRAGEDLSQLPGIGKYLATKIEVIVRTGSLPSLTDPAKHIPQTLIDRLSLPGLGYKRIKKLYQALQLKNLEDLKRAATEHKICQIPGFSEKSEEKILLELKRWASSGKRFLMAHIADFTKELKEYLQELPGINEIVIAGSFRRRCEIVGDLYILVTAQKGVEVIKAFVNYPKVKLNISQSSTRSTVRLLSGLRVNLRVVPKIRFGAALLFFTGSRAHHIELRNRAVKKGLKLNEYGIFEGNKCLARKTENEIYKILDLPYIPPELRENRGEFAAAEENKLPRLIELEDIRGDLHAHTTETDGVDTLENMVQAAIELKYEYLAITDHTQNLKMVHGQDEKRLLKQIKKIEKLNKIIFPFRILASAEVDILPDGSLDIADEVLAQLDITVCSIHSKFKFSKEQQTSRILKAMENPYFSILGHPTGRLLNRREPYQIDLEAIIKAAKKYGHCLEINAQPSRMDINDRQCQLAKEYGVKLAISTDAHNTAQLRNMRFGVGQARRGWLEAGDIINTLSLNKLLRYLGKS